jgi:ATP-dependent protease ClpP protease subunit
MNAPEALLARLIPGDLEKQVPAAVQRVLPGGLRNRLIQIALGLLISVGLAFVVRRMVERREARRRPLAPPPRTTALANMQSAEPPATGVVAHAMTDTAPQPAPSLASEGEQGRATRYPLLAAPHIVLHGPVDHDMYTSFRHQLAHAPGDGPLVISISSLGGDPEVARLMGDEVRLLREYSGREVLFLGKVAVYSAAATFMSAFPADKRFLTKGTRLMIHERQMTKTIEVSGPLRACIASLQATLHEIEQSIEIEEEGFRDIIAGSEVGFDEVRARAPANWYICDHEAREKGLVLDVI